ncbi:hypothetical protein FEA44_05975 [Mannheimia haemolytica]|uniref:Uncharacterized protein n=1 Tax=Mannheimia haemolytica TaxID=75985 RepID=A0A547F761_MANHA|nr:hypothetical protein C4O85_04395 [Mannheimia haemolytica]AWW71038.1 hypothetical protein C4O86_04155 [Pasteurellaceae bacterium 12565]AWW66172.1 hypothetical protein C4O91_04015 [Mannheimia haemolytica]AWW68583.1 hypothetical protein C4O89_04100 [Mannheimia haemolytica]TRB32631.1 hypothetical protein FEB90_04355 [Mannheimia haemolytica]
MKGNMKIFTVQAVIFEQFFANFYDKSTACKVRARTLAPSETLLCCNNLPVLVIHRNGFIR